MSYIRTRIRNRLDFEIVACRMVKEKRRKEKKKLSLICSFFPEGEKDQLKGREKGGKKERSKTETRIDICITRRR